MKKLNFLNQLLVRNLLCCISKVFPNHGNIYINFFLGLELKELERKQQRERNNSLDDFDLLEDESFSLIPKNGKSTERNEERYSFDWIDESYQSSILMVHRIQRILSFLLLIESGIGIFTTYLYGYSTLLASIIANILNLFLFLCKAWICRADEGPREINILLLFYVVYSVIATMKIVGIVLFYQINYGIVSCMKYEMDKSHPQLLGPSRYFAKNWHCVEATEAPDKNWWDCYCYNHFRDICIYTEAYSGEEATVEYGCHYMVSLIPIFALSLLILCLFSGLITFWTCFYLSCRDR